MQPSMMGHEAMARANVRVLRKSPETVQANLLVAIVRLSRKLAEMDGYTRKNRAVIAGGGAEWLDVPAFVSCPRGGTSSWHACMVAVEVPRRLATQGPIAHSVALMLQRAHHHTLRASSHLYASTLPPIQCLPLAVTVWRPEIKPPR